LNHHNHNIHDHLPLARQAMSYFDASPDPFHAVQTSIDLLQQAGFTEWDDSDSTTTTSSIIIKPGDKYYFTRNKSTLVAFHVGRHYQPGHGGFVMIGGHTDSPNLKVKTRSKRGSSSSSSSSSGSLIQIGVECYGGGLWHTWFDRDLGISGRVMIQRHDDNSHQRRIEQRLMKIDRAVLRISNLAIHLRTEEERKAFAINKEDHLSPILAMAALKALTTTTTTTTGDGEVTTLKAGDSVEEENDKDTEKMKEDDDDKHKKTNSHTITKKDGWTEHQEPILLQLLATELQVAVEDIIDFELNLFDVQKASLGGASSEFIYSARLDNLASCFLAVQALVEHALEEDEKEGEQSEGAKDIAMIVLYDHEEVGSGSA
jgi:aspartyl aminopeptidase